MVMTKSKNTHVDLEALRAALDWRSVAGDSRDQMFQLYSGGDKRVTIERIRVVRWIYWGLWIAMFVFMIGVVFALMGFLPTSDESLWGGTPIAHAVACGIFTVGCGLGGWYAQRYLSRRHVFDLSSGMYWQGRGEVGQVCEHGYISRDEFSLKKICALQIVTKWCKDSSSTHKGFYGHELNMVLVDSSRINLLNQEDKRSLTSDARELSAFLGVPIWSAPDANKEDADVSGSR